MDPRFARNPKQLVVSFLFRSGMRILFAACIVITLFLSMCVTRGFGAARRAQTQAKATAEESKPVTLEPGKPIERTLQGGEKHRYEIRAENGQFLHAVVEQLGIDVVLTLYAADGKPIASMDSPNGKFGLEKISTITEVPGIYMLEVASGDKNMPAGRYRVTVDPLRAPGDQDRARITAERTFVEAVQLQEQGSADSLQGAIQKYTATVPLWQAAGDDYEEALTRYTIGSLFAGLGETKKALEFYAGALTLDRAIEDRFGEVSTLNNMGNVYNATGEKQKALDHYNQELPLERAMENKIEEGVTLNNIGSVYDALGEKQKALDTYMLAVPLEHAVGELGMEAILFNNIGKVYADLGELQKALDYYNQALSLDRGLEFHPGEARDLGNIGGVYKDLGQKQKALEFYMQALPLWRAVGDRDGEAVTVNNIGTVYEDLGEKQKALEFYMQALPLRRAVGDRAGEATTLSNIGIVYDHLGEKQKAGLLRSGAAAASCGGGSVWRSRHARRHGSRL
jgi:tetratricopeptide (TPR) repeat protein